MLKCLYKISILYNGLKYLIVGIRFEEEKLGFMEM